MKPRLFVFLLLMSFLHPFSYADILINEFMQSNIDGLLDDLNEFPDSWVELYNDDDTPVDIQNWYLSDKANYNKGWQIKESAIIPGKGYLIIYCDKAETGLHTSFRLESGKDGAIYLFDHTGALIDKVVDIPKQPAPNIACGRTADGGEEWGYFIEATPGASNNGITADIVSPSPLFSLAGGIYTQEVSVSLSLPPDVAEGIELSDIYYTTDGSEPTGESMPYTESIAITGSTSLRAKIIAPGYLINRSVVQSYIITDRDLTLPVVSLTLNPEFLWDDDLGIYTVGNDPEKPNYENNWRRPMNIEYFPAQGESSVINQLEEMRISGGFSRKYPLKSLILYANKRFGVKRYNYQLFNEKPGQEIKSFMLRNAGNDFIQANFRDAAIQLFMGGKVDVDYQAYQPAILFINGEYLGVENIRERSEEDFVLANYDGLEDIDMIEGWYGEAKVGDREAISGLINTLTLPVNKIPYEAVMNQIDIDEYINYMILQIYVANTDFPHNNVVLWRPRTPEGKWRFIIKDTDHGLGYFNLNESDFNALTYNIDESHWAKFFFSKLIAHETFKEKFYTRFAIYMGDILSNESTKQIIDSIRHMIEPEMIHHINKWKGQAGVRTIESWRNVVDGMNQWCEERNPIMYEHLNSYFDLKGLTAMTLTVPEELDIPRSVSINDVVLRKPSFDGQYYTGETLQIKWLGDESVTVGWQITATVGEQTFSREFASNEAEYIIPENCTQLAIVAGLDIDGVNGITPADIRAYVSGNQLYVSGLTPSSTVKVYDVAGRILSENKTDHQMIQIPLQQKGVMMVQIMNEGKSVFTKKIVNGLR